MKASGSYASLVRGVSQQVPQDRQPGQHTEQVNMIPDPVQGLTRRHGSRWVAEKSLGLNAALIANFTSDTSTFRTFEYSNANNEYVLLMRNGAKASGSTLPAIIAYNRTTKAFLTYTRNTVDAQLDLLENGGISAAAAVGKYVFMAGHTTVAAATSAALWSATNLDTVVWIRGGAYSRTFKVTVTKLDNSQVSFEYTTPTSSYPGTLDTSGVSAYIPDTAGAGSSSSPTVGAAIEYPSVVTLHPGNTYTLVHGASTPTNVVISFHMGTGDGAEQGEYVLGIDYTISSVGVITWLASSGDFLRGVEAFRINDSNNVSIFYNYETGGSTTTAPYATVTDVESAYIKKVGNYGLADLGFGDWQPTALIVSLNYEAMTNSYPAAPGVGQFSWPPGGKSVLFHVGMVNNPFVLIEYTHTKTLTNPNYAKAVNDIVNTFNTNVTNWIGSAAEAIQPNNIAEQLRLAAVAAGLTTATRNASTVIFNNVKSLTVNDGGDGSLIRGVANEVVSIDDVTDIHKVGKIIKVKAREAKEAFYLKAVAKDPIVTSGYTEVTWVEAVGVEHTVTSALVYATVSGPNLYVASSATLLNTILAGTHPAYLKSTVGDADSSPLPFFIGKKITYLGVFQDRLLVGAGAVLRCSKIGDYLNFFRSSVLTVPADDPLEMLSQGSEDDVLRYSTLYDRDLVVFGDKRQYAISGRQALTPTAANMQVMSNHSNAADIPPLAVGGVIFYGQIGEKSSSIHEIQPGLVAESPESFINSSQIDTYLTGSVIELCNNAKPTHIFARTTGARNSVFVFSYLDKQGAGRVQDAWNRWDFNPSLGPIIGMSRTPDGLLVYRLQTGIKSDASGTDTWVVADLCPLTTGLATYPYLDSIRPWSQVNGGTQAVHNTTLGPWHIAFDGTSEFQFIGDDLLSATALLAEFPTATGPRVGAMQPCYVIPTNPFVRDKNDKAITTGRLVVTKFAASVTDTSGFITEITSNEQTVTQEFNGRVMGDINNEIGREPVTDALQSIPVGRETREFELKIKARTWLPFTLTSLEWVGQFFNRTQRF